MKRKAKLWSTQSRYLQMIALTLRPETVRGARSVTNGFIRYLEKNHREISCFSQLRRRHIEAWLLHLARGKLQRISRRDCIVRTRRFLDVIRLWRWREAPRKALFRRGDVPAVDRGLPKPLSHASDRILQAELRKRGGLTCKALLFMRATGLRRGEILNLKVDSLRKLPGGQWALHVPLGKLHNERVLPIDKKTAKIFEEIRKLRGSPPPAVDPETGKPAHFLIVHRDGRRFCCDCLRYHLEKIEKEAGLKEHPTPHRLRHSYATEMLRAGVSLPVLMKLLGHRSLGMTLRYAEVTGVDVRRAYFKALELTGKQYEVPPLTAMPPRIDRKLTSWRSVAAHLEAFAREVESFRRDNRKRPKAKRAQRLVERLRRIAGDFDGLGA